MKIQRWRTTCLSSPFSQYKNMVWKPATYNSNRIDCVLKDGTSLDRKKQMLSKMPLSRPVYGKVLLSFLHLSASPGTSHDLASI